MRTWLSRFWRWVSAIDTGNWVLSVVPGTLIAGGIGLWAYVSSYPGPVISVLVLVALAACLYLFMQMLAWKKRPVQAQPVAPSGREALTQIIDGHYSGETVRLDGHSYINCVFERCTIDYGGGDYDLLNCQVSGAISFRSDNKFVDRGFSLMASMLKADEKIDGRGNRRVTISVSLEPGGTKKQISRPQDNVTR